MLGSWLSPNSEMSSAPSQSIPPKTAAAIPHFKTTPARPPSKAALKVFPPTKPVAKKSSGGRRRQPSATHPNPRPAAQQETLPRRVDSYPSTTGGTLDDYLVTPPVNSPIGLPVPGSPGSAFSPVSHLGLSPLGLSPPRLALSTGGALLRNPVTSFVQLAPPPPQQLLTSNTLCQSTPQQQPLLIVQPCSAMQLPFISLAYPSYVSTPKTDATTACASTTPVQPQAPVVGEESGVRRGRTKRAAADSTAADPSERKRRMHLQAEQSRRSALKDGFDQLEALLPQDGFSSSKPTNAMVLAKASEYIQELLDQRRQKQVEAAEVKDKVGHLNSKISAYHTHLPPASSSATDVRNSFRLYVKQRSNANWKFWLLGKMMGQLFDSFGAEVEGQTPAQVLVASRQWARRRCQLLNLRPMVSEILVEIATDTPMLYDPEKMEQFVKQQDR